MHKRLLCFLFAISCFTELWGANIDQQRLYEETNPTNISFQSADGDYSLILNFLLQGDVVDFSHNNNDLHGGIHRRKTEIHIHGNITHNWGYHFSYHLFTHEFHTIAISYSGFQDQSIYAGQIAPNFGLSNSSSTPYLSFMETSVDSNAFGTSFYKGFQYQIAFRDKYNLQFSLFKPGTVSSQTTADADHIPGRHGTGAIVRFIYSPFHKDRKLLHLGVDYWHQQTNGDHSVNFSSHPDIDPPHGGSLVNTGNILQSKSYDLYDVEAASNIGSLNLIAEWFNAYVYRYQGFNRPHFDGYDLNVGYFLTGENRVYLFKYGSFAGISKIQHNYGAIEVAARYDTLNLQNSGIQGGKEHDISLGLTWYINTAVATKINYIHAMADPADNGRHSNINILAARLQLLF